MLSLRKPWHREGEGAECLDVGGESSPWLWLQRGQSVGLNRGQGCYGKRGVIDPEQRSPSPTPSTCMQFLCAIMVQSKCLRPPNMSLLTENWVRTEHRVTDSLSLSWTVAIHPHSGYNRNRGLEEPGKPDVKWQMTEYLGTIDNVCLRPPRVGAAEHSIGFSS